MDGADAGGLKTGVKGGKWYSLIDKVYPEAALRAAFTQVAANRGAAGVDHVTIAKYASDLDVNLARLSEALRSGTHRPQRIRRHYIPKPGSQGEASAGDTNGARPGGPDGAAHGWSRSSSGTLHPTATAFAPDGDAKRRCGGSMGCSKPATSTSSTPTPAFAGAGLYGALVVKGDISLDRNRVVGRLPATPRGRDRRWSVACRPALSFRDSAADYPANHGILLAGGPRRRLRRPSVPAVEQHAGLVPRVKRDVAGAAGRGAGLAFGSAHRGSAEAGSGHAEFLLSIVTVTFPRTIRGEPASGRRTSRLHSCIRGSGADRTMMQPCASTARFRGGGPIL